MSSSAARVGPDKMASARAPDRTETATDATIAEGEALLAIALVGVAFMRDREILRCNRRFAQMFGYAPEELAGKSMKVLFPSAEDFAATCVRAYRALETLGSYREERAFLRKDGSELWCSLAGQLFAGEKSNGEIIWIAEDLSERRRAESELRRSEERLALALRAADSGIWDWDIETDNKFYSPRYRELLGYRNLSNERFCAAFKFHEALHPEDRERVWEARKRAFDARSAYRQVFRLRCKDGAYRWFEGRGQAQYNSNGMPARFAGSITDVTEQREREEALAQTRAEVNVAQERLRDAIERIPDAFALFDADDRLVLCNRKYVDVFAGGADPENLAGTSFEDLARLSILNGEVIPAQFNGDAEAWVAECVRMHRNPEAGEILLQMGSGRWFQMRERRTRDGGIVGVRSDVTEIKASEAHVRHLAYHDPLTGLPNRRLLQDRMERSFTLARRNKTQVGVLLVDLDNFKTINDQHGHRVGDEVLREMASRLRICVREADTVVRHGGDEFVVLLPELQRAQDAARVADKIIEEIAAPVRVDALELHVSASIGISFYPTDGHESDTLVWMADKAMYRMKQAGGSGMRFAAGEEAG
ncbi:MAG: diguanylate cyclase [Betaproteobacteria bacterium]|nr:diguanylate cyclase [Betaproteobacteria bacterium]